MKTFNGMISLKIWAGKMRIFVFLAMGMSLFHSLFSYNVSGLVTDKYNGTYPGFTVLLSNGVTNYNRTTDANGYFLFDSITNGAYTLNVVVPNYMKFTLSNYSISVASADFSTNFLVNLGNNVLTASVSSDIDFQIPPYFLGNRSDSLSIQVIKKTAATQRVVISLTKLNGREKYVIYDGSVTGQSSRVTLFSESIRNKLTIGAYVMEALLVTKGDAVLSADNPIRRRIFVYSE